MSAAYKTRAELRAALLADAEALVDAVIDGLSAAGGEPEWDSGTIEDVLHPFLPVIERAGMTTPLTAFPGHRKTQRKGTK